MRWFKSFVLVLGLLTTAACTKVPAGNVGVLVNLYGDDKGVNATETKGPGRYWVGWNQDLFLFPTFTQTRTWTRSDGLDESITFQSLDGSIINTDAGVTFHVDPNKVPLLFQRYRKGIDEITEVYVHNMVRDAFVEEASKLNVEAVYGSGKSDLVHTVQQRVASEIEPTGLVIEKIYLVGTLRLPQSVANAINAKNAAIQMAEQRKNEIIQSQAEAQKEIARAQGEAQAQLTLAEASAKAIKIKGDALRENPGLVQFQAVEKWDGKLPQVSGVGGTPFIQLPSR